MLVTAYHMKTVFTNLRASTRDRRHECKRFLVYSTICIVFPACLITICCVFYFIQSHGKDMGYGGEICFLNNRTAIIAFFAGPLGGILLLNSYFVVWTVLVIRSVPDMHEASNKANKHYVLVYIKMSLLFGFTWIFGYMAVVFKSDIFWYLFTVLTGSQGVMTFMAYCTNGRNVALIKETFFVAKVLTSDSSKPSVSGNRHLASNPD